MPKKVKKRRKLTAEDGVSFELLLTAEDRVSFELLLTAECWGRGKLWVRVYQQIKIIYTALSRALSFTVLLKLVLFLWQTETGWEEYFDYIFPDDQAAQPNLKLLALAKQWKEQAEPAGGENPDADSPGEESSSSSSEEEEDEEESGESD